MPAGIGRPSALTCLNPHHSGHFIPVITRKRARFLRVNISSANSITARISMKTITKLQMLFSPSCIMNLGTPAWLPMYSLRPRLVSTLPFAAPRIFDNCINRHHPAGRRSHAGWRWPIACDSTKDRNPPANTPLSRQLLVLAMNFVIFRQLADKLVEWAVPYIERAFGLKRPEFQTNLIPKSDSCPRTQR